MSVLVAFASRYGATRQIAQQIGAVLSVAGHDVRVRPAAAVEAVRDHEAVVLGSSVYRGHWMEQAAAFADRYRAALTDRPVWLFSSGMLADDEGSTTGPSDLDRYADLLGARSRQAFGGALVVRRLDLIDQALRLAPSRRRALRSGDLRDWVDIDHWAHQIAAELSASTLA
ncbi:MAG: flavodoxin domain-containing protein [Nocardioides sp.]|nr:flavodoxin domain-containing protein [Nocardioides sp.]